MRCLFRLAVLGALAAVALYASLNYRVIHAKDGLHLVKKNDWTWDKTWVDTRDWTAMDFLREQEIGEQLAEIKWRDLKDGLADAWDDLSRQLDDWSKELAFDERSDQFREQWQKLRAEAKQRYDALKKQLDDRDINRARFNELLQQLNGWMTEQYEKMKARFEGG